MELYGIHMALKHWRHLLATGNPITLYTDHKSLTSPVEPDTTTTPAPIAHWLHHIYSYRINFRYIKGCDNHLADTLSRFHPAPPTPQV
jgi:hypothetical protein